MVTVADLLQLKDGIRGLPSLLLQLVICIVTASILMVIWLFIRWLNCWRNFRRTLVGLTIFATLLAVFYAEENWRGQRVWESCQRELAAKGIELDWNKYIPPVVPDEQNFFTASTNIYLRFVKHPQDDQQKLASQLHWLDLRAPDTISFTGLRLDKSRRFAFVKPVVVAELAIQPLQAITNQPGVIQLTDPAAAAHLQTALQNGVGRSLKGAPGFTFSERSLANFSPVIIALAADATPWVSEVAKLVPPNLFTNIGHLTVVATANPHVLQVQFDSGYAIAAADYLRWSDQYVPAFDDLRAALQRPYAIVPGDYSQPFLVPIPNFVTMRFLAQTLAQRTQCYLLLGQSDKALQELTLIHDSCRILQKLPTGQPKTLVEAMINVFISGVYIAVVQDGLRLHAWQEPQLADIQEQLKNINLPTYVADGYKWQLVVGAHILNELTTSKNIDSILMQDRYLYTIRPFLILSPRGWIYQNMTTLAKIESKIFNAFDLEHDTIAPTVCDAAEDYSEKTLAHNSPFKVWARMAVPNFNKAMQNTAFNQILADQGQIACALERYHLVRGNYPEALDALVPAFMAKLPHDLIGGQPLHYRRTDDGKFLLYSVGWNETDDGGMAGKGNSDYDSRLRGDWVWQSSAK